jgi:hypothetical protein
MAKRSPQLKHLRKMLTDVERMNESSRERITVSKEALRDRQIEVFRRVLKLSR